MTFFPDDWRDLASETGALKGLRKDKSPDGLLRVLLMHLACGHSLRETVVRARQAGLADLSDVALMKRLRKSRDWLRCPLHRAVRASAALTCPSRTDSRFGAFDATVREGAGEDRLALACPLQCPPAIADLRLLPYHGGVRCRNRRVLCAVPGSSRGLRARRPRLFHGTGDRPCRVVRRPGHGACQHWLAGLLGPGRQAFRPARGSVVA